MSNLFPMIQPYRTQFITVTDGHRLYVEELGNPDGLPVIFLHGGPGGGISPLHRCFYDPMLYRIILFDQRGSGQSTPHACLEANTSQHLLDDIEQIRESLQISQWVVAGGSWGTTLALLYGIAYPSRVSGLILRGVFLARQQDLAWLYAPDEGASQVFPDFYKEFIAPIEPHVGNAEDVIKAYRTLMHSDNEIERMHAVKEWATWEGRVSKLRHDPSQDKQYAEPHSALSLALIENHFFYHNCFIEENYILDHVDQISHIPAIMVHGRYDMVCKIENAVTLSAVLPRAELLIVQEAGHSASEPGIAKALCLASNKLFRQLVRR